MKRVVVVVAVVLVFLSPSFGKGKSGITKEMIRSTQIREELNRFREMNRGIRDAAEARKKEESARKEASLAARIVSPEEAVVPYFDPPLAQVMEKPSASAAPSRASTQPRPLLRQPKDSSEGVSAAIVSRSFTPVEAGEESPKFKLEPGEALCFASDCKVVKYDDIGQVPKDRFPCSYRGLPVKLHYNVLNRLDSENAVLVIKTGHQEVTLRMASIVQVK